MRWRSHDFRARVWTMQAHNIMPHNEGKVGVHAFSTDGRKWAMGQPATAYTTHVTWSDGSQVISVCLVASPACAHSPLHPHLTLPGPGPAGWLLRRARWGEESGRC